MVAWCVETSVCVFRKRLQRYIRMLIFVVGRNLVCDIKIIHLKVFKFLLLLLQIFLFISIVRRQATSAGRMFVRSH